MSRLAAQNRNQPEPHVNKSAPTLIASKSVFVPRGTATYTPKWSIVVLAVACFGVLKFNGLHGKTEPARERPTTASFLPVGDSSTGPIRIPAEGIANVHIMNRWMGAEPVNKSGNAYRVGSRGEGSNRIDSAAIDHLKNRK